MTPAAGSVQSMPIFPPRCSAIVVSRLGDPSLLTELQSIARYFFSRPVDHYVEMDNAQYRGLLASAQDEINRREMARRLAQDRRSELAAILGTDEIMIQTNLYLRGTRPRHQGDQEHVDWHRESFYGPDLGASINLWMPVLNVSIDNAMRYVPDSHLIPDEAIETASADHGGVTRFSPGHRVGLLYSPKRIVGGVDFSNQRPLVVVPGEVAIFSGALIHGAAENRSALPRFSVDLRAIAEANLTVSKTHFASGKAYFERL